MAQGVMGPDLTHFGSRTTLGGGILENDPYGTNLTRWLQDPEAIKPGNLMSQNAPIYQIEEMRLSKDDIADLVSYLQSLK